MFTQEYLLLFFPLSAVLIGCAIFVQRLGVFISLNPRNDICLYKGCEEKEA